MTNFGWLQKPNQKLFARRNCGLVTNWWKSASWWRVSLMLGGNSFNVNDVLGSSSTTCTVGKHKHLRGETQAFQQHRPWSELTRPPSAGASHWSSITALHWLNSISNWLRMNEVWRGCVTNSPAGLSLLGSPPCPGGPRRGKTAAAAQGARADTACQRVLSANVTEQRQTLTGGPSLPGRPCVPFFPWGPCWMKVSRLTLSFSNAGAQTQEHVFHLLSRHPNQPLRTRKTLQERRNHGFLVSLSFLKCRQQVFFGPFCALIPGYRGCLAVQVLQFHLGSPVANRKWCHEKHVGPQTPVFYHQSTHYVSLWALNAINSSNTLWGNNTRQLTAQSKSYLSVDSLVLAPSQNILDSAVEEMTSVSDEVFRLQATFSSL